jgi:GST-like protein
MIDLYFWPTSNNKKVTIMLHEVDVPYRIKMVNFLKGENYREDFLALNLNAKTPVIVDDDGPGGKPITLFESGAILLYLAEKTGTLVPRDAAARWAVTQWVFFQAASIGPMFGQHAHFFDYAPEDVPYAKDRYLNEVRRLYGVLDKRLSASPYLAGADYSIADIMVWPWIQWSRQHQSPDEWKALKAWHDTIGARPAVQAGFKVGTELQKPGAVPMTVEQKRALFARRF